MANTTTRAPASMNDPKLSARIERAGPRSSGAGTRWPSAGRRARRPRTARSNRTVRAPSRAGQGACSLRGRSRREPPRPGQRRGRQDQHGCSGSHQCRPPVRGRAGEGEQYRIDDVRGKDDPVGDAPQHQVGLADGGTDRTEIRERRQWANQPNRQPIVASIRAPRAQLVRMRQGVSMPARTCPSVTTRDRSGGHRLRCRWRWW